MNEAIKIIESRLDNLLQQNDLYYKSKNFYADIDSRIYELESLLEKLKAIQ